jgi:hypothetical protein
MRSQSQGLVSISRHQPIEGSEIARSCALNPVTFRIYRLIHCRRGIKQFGRRSLM